MESNKSVEHVVQCYGDMLFDLCDSILWNTAAAQSAFRAIMKDIHREHGGNKFATHERSWILRVACDRIRSHHEKHGRQLTLHEQIELDAAANVANRLKRFSRFFRRLEVEDRMVLLLRDKYGLPYGELSAALGIPEGSLKIRRQQALQALEEWIWDNQ